jgi:hypothetical protein
MRQEDAAMGDQAPTLREHFIVMPDDKEVSLDVPVNAGEQVAYVWQEYLLDRNDARNGYSWRVPDVGYGQQQTTGDWATVDGETTVYGWYDFG